MQATAILEKTRPAFARDFALVGALSSLLAPALVVRGAFGLGYLAASTAAGLLFGALVGALTATVLGRLGRVPLSLLFLAGPTLGLAWGAAVGASSGLVLPEDWWTVSMAFASVCAAVQFGWFWLPYTVRRVRGKSAWPLVVLACALPVLVYGGLWITG